MNAFHRRCFASGLAGLFVLASLPNLSACACCSDPGEYVLRAGDPVEEYQLTQIQGMTFASAAQLYLTDAGEEEDAQGISSVLNHYRLTVAMEAGRWRMTFRAENGKTGTLTLPFPTAMTVFAARRHLSALRATLPQGRRDSG